MEFIEATPTDDNLLKCPRAESERRTEAVPAPSATDEKDLVTPLKEANSGDQEINKVIFSTPTNLAVRDDQQPGMNIQLS